ncbi:MAG TPA: M4 family metallopeptidase [Vicinamibacterales bacterium]
MKFWTSLRRVCLAVCLSVLIAAAAARWPLFAQAQSDRPFEPTALQESACLAFGAVESARNPTTGALRFIGTPTGFPLTHPLGHDARTDPETAARGFLSVCGSLFGLSGDPADLALERAETTDDRRAIVRFQQMAGGLPVFGGEIIVHLDPNRNVMATIGKVLPQARTGTVAAVTSADAARFALEATARVHGVQSQDLVAASPQLWVFNAALIGPGLNVPRLVWRTEVTPRTLSPIRELVLIDAALGSVALQFNQIDTALQRSTYTANNTTSLPGTLVCSESDPGCAAGDAHAAAAHIHAGDTYNFYKVYHGRDGIDGAGGAIKSTVHYSSGYLNAFWNGTQMVYGDAAGFPLADDVVGHELTHGVTQNTSNLFYYYQSGAINESLSDMWGEFVDQTNGHGTDTPGVKWLLGEDVTGLGAIRNMSDPPAFADPDRMTSPNYFTFSSDNGGVHTNSGINNKAAFLMVDGGTFNGQTITGLGIYKTAKIYYEAQTHLLTSSADYGDLFNALFQACNNLVGTADIFSDDCQQVRKATLAVEMNLQPVTDFNPDAQICPIGQAPANVFFDNLESGSANFTTITLAGTNRWGYDSSPYGAYAHSGRHYLYANDSPGVTTDTSLVMTNGVTLPANAFLHFAHAFDFENPAYDGGVVEYSNDNGASWIDAGPLFDNVGYTGTIYGFDTNPLKNRPAFIGDSHGYISSRLNLSSLAGQTVKFRWRMGLDSIISNFGWWLDDIRIYTCANVQPPGAAESPTPADGATGIATNTRLTWSALGATSYDMAFGIVNPPPPVANDLPGASYTPVLAPNTTYYWRVTSRNTSGGNPGPVWSFTTSGPLPTDLLVRDTFDSSPGALTSHMPDVTVGTQTWSVTGGTPIPTVAGGVVGVTSGSGHLQATIETGVTDIRMGVDYRVGASAQQLAALAFRYTDANHYLLLMFYQNALHLYRRDGPSLYTLLASSAPLAPIANGSTQRMEVRTSGSQLTGWWNGLPVVVATDTVQLNATRHGLDWNSAFDASAAFDNFEIRNAGAALLPPGTPTSPAPADGATGVPYNSPLSWSSSSVTSYDIAVGTANPPPPVATGLTSASYTPSLTGNTTYYWQVTARNAFATTPGPVWSFTTGSLPADLLVRDTFNSGSGPITSHTPDVNPGGAAAWIATGASPVPTVNNGVVGITPGTGHLQATIDAGAPDIRMFAEFPLGGGGQVAALAFRLTDANNHLLLMFYQNALHFYRRQAGTYTLLASSALLPPAAAGSTQQIEVRTSGSQLSGWWNGVQVVQTTETFQQSATRHGLDWNSQADVTTTFDNFEIRNTGAPLVPPAVPTTPTPANGASAVGLSAALAWSAAGATSYDLAFGTANPPSPVATNLSSASYKPTLTANTTYYWQVTARNSRGSTTGPVWSFTTGSLAPDLLVTDTFTGTGLLTAHTPDVNAGGGPWSVTGGTPIPTLSGAVVGVTAGSGHLQATLETGAPDIRMGADYVVGSGGQQLAALAFRLTDGNNHFILMFYQNALYFYRKQTGTYTLLASSPPLAPPASGNILRLEVRTSGSQMTGWVNGIQVVQATDTFQQSATRHGLDWNSAYDSSATFDNLEIRNIGAPLVPPDAPTAPSPANNASSVSPNATLTWSAPGATSYDVAFGTANPPAPVAMNLTTTSYKPTLIANTTYYWQVTARNLVGSTAGPVWTFTTGAPPIDVVVTDTFTGTGLLTAHAPDVNVLGGPWTVTGGTPIPALNAGVVGVTPGSGHVQATLETGVPDIRMGADYVVGASGQSLAALVFRLTDTYNHFLLMYYQNALRIYRRYDGFYTLLASSAPLAPLSAGSILRMEVRTSGSQMTGWVNGVMVVEAMDTFQQTATRHGLDWNSAFDATAAFDNLEIRNNGAPPLPPGIPMTPSPVNNSSGVTPIASLAWSAARAASYDVSFGTVNPPAPAAVGLPNPTYTPTLAPNTTYYWQVIARNGVGSTTGPVWTFTTGAQPSDLLVKDTFTAAPGTLLAEHVPDVNPAGGRWRILGTATPTISDGAVVMTATTGNQVQATVFTGASDIRMSVDYKVGTSSKRYAGLLFRYFGFDGYLLLAFSDNALRFYQHFGFGTDSTLLASSAPLPPVASGSVQRIEVRAIGSQLTGWWNGVQVVQTTMDPGPLPATAHGLNWDVSLDPTAEFDNFEIHNIGAPILPPEAPQDPTPGDLATNVPTNFEPHWQMGVGGNSTASYDVAFGTVNPPPPFETGNTSQRIDPFLANGTTYYWQVIARNAGGSTPGPVWTFTTQAPPPPPGIPTITSPANGATGVELNRSVSWFSTNATSYDVSFGTVNPPPPVASGLDRVGFFPTLSLNTTYYWQVTAHNAGGSAAGPVWSFTTTTFPSDFIVSDSFTGSGSLTSHTPDLSRTGPFPWHVTGGPPAPTLNGGTVGVTAGAGHVQATISAVADVRMGVDYRVGNGTNQLAALAFRLFDANNHFLLMYFQNALHFYRKQNGVYTLLASSVPLPPVAAGSTQRMEVRTSGSVMTGFWNGIQYLQAVDSFQQTATGQGLDWNAAYDPTATFDNFEIRYTNPPTPSSPPGLPTPTSPVIGATGVSTNPLLTWSSEGATSYSVEFGTQNPPPPLLSGGTALPAWAPPSTLNPNTKYYWRVTARKGNSDTQGPVWSFTTGTATSGLLAADTFAGTGALTAHTPDLGGPWIVTGSSPIPTIGGGVAGVSPGSGHLQATLDAGASDVRVAADFRAGASAQQLAALVFRLSDEDNYLLLMFYQNALHFYRRQAGVYTLLASSAPLAPVADGSSRRLEVRASGSQLTGWWNGVQLLSVAETFNQTATRHGLNWNSAYDATATFDNFEVKNVVGGSVP